MQRSLSTAARIAAFGLSLAAAASAQCSYTWTSSFGSGCDELVNSVAVDGGGDLIVAGSFSNAGGVAANFIASFDGAAWSALGSGTDGPVREIVRMPNGDIVAGGAFANAGGVSANCIARWNGASWSALASGVDAQLPFGSFVSALAVLGNGDLVIGGSFAAVSGVPASNIARWDGAAWSALGAGTNGQVRDLAVMPNGDLVAVGAFSTAGGAGASNVARWNGSSWSSLGSGVGLFGANAVTGLLNGDVLVGGAFATAGGSPAQSLARWNGATWSAVGAGANGPVSALKTLPSGDVLLGGVFTSVGGVAANRIAKWDTTNFFALAAGCDDTVTSFEILPSGELAVGGAFLNAGGSAATRIAQVSSSCGSATSVIGVGCSGTGGLNELTVTQPPQLGGTFRAVGTGMPPAAFVMVLYGFAAASLPISVVFPQAGAGCTLYSTGEVIEATLPVAGQATSALPIPIDPNLIGAMLTHQYVPIEVDAMLGFQLITSTNGISLTIGSF